MAAAGATRGRDGPAMGLGGRGAGGVASGGAGRGLEGPAVRALGATAFGGEPTAPVTTVGQRRGRKAEAAGKS